MSRATTSRDARALILGAIAVVGALIAFRGGPQLVSWTRHERELSARTLSAFADARRLALARHTLRDSLKIARARLASIDSAFISGRSISHAAANLARDLSENAEATDARVEGLQADSVSDAGAVIRRVRVRGSVTGDLAAIMQFLLLVETGPRILAIRDLTLSRRSAASGAQREVIQASFLIEGMAAPRPSGAR